MSTATTGDDRAERDAARQAAAVEANAAAARRQDNYFRENHNGMSEAEWTKALAAPRKIGTGYEAHGAGCGMVRVFFYETDRAYSWSTLNFSGTATLEGELVTIHERLSNGSRITLPADAADFPAAIRETVKRIVEHWNGERARQAAIDRVNAEAAARKAEDDRRTRLGPAGRAEEDVNRLSADVARLSADVSVLTSQIAALVSKAGGKP